MLSGGASTLSSLVLVLVRAMKDYGIDVRGAFSEVGLDYALLNQAGARYPDEAIARLWLILIDRVEDQCVGLRIAEYWHPTALHALGFAWMASETLKEAFERLIRYNQFVSESQDYELRETDSTFRFVIHPAAEDYPFPDADYDANFSVLYDMCRSVYGEDFSLMRVDLRRARPNCAEKFKERFKAPVVFGAEENIIYISRNVALKPLPTANADLARINEEIVDQYLAQLTQGEMSVRVRTKLIQRLPSGNISQDEVASELFMSARTLQRRLKEEGISYQEVLRSTREDLATRYMKDEQTSVSEIAYLLGFSEVANFTRAFKSWTGVAPTDYRQALREQ